MRAGRSSLVCLAGMLLTASSAFAQNHLPAGATIEVRLPAEAELWFDGHPTAQQGERRIFATPGLRSGVTYTYDVMARWQDGGEDVVRRDRVVVWTGQIVMLQFTRSAPRTTALDHVSIQEIARATSAAKKPSARRRLPGHMSLVEFDELPH